MIEYGQNSEDKHWRRMFNGASKTMPSFGSDISSYVRKNDAEVKDEANSETVKDHQYGWPNPTAIG